jgi:hypothetical protein
MSVLIGLRYTIMGLIKDPAEVGKKWDVREKR